MNFVSKTNIFDFFGDVSRKTKANDLLKNVGLTLLVFKQYIAYKYVLNFKSRKGKNHLVRFCALHTAAYNC